MPPDPPRAFVVLNHFQICSAEKNALKKYGNYGFPLLKFLATPLFMTKKLCGPLAYWQVTKWPATANRFVTPDLNKRCCDI